MIEMQRQRHVVKLMNMRCTRRRSLRGNVFERAQCACEDHWRSHLATHFEITGSSALWMLNAGTAAFYLCVTAEDISLK